MASNFPQSPVLQSTSGTSTQDIRNRTKPSTNRPKPESISSKQVMKEGEYCSTCGTSDHKSSFCSKILSTLHSATSLINTSITPEPNPPYQDFQRVWPRPAARYPIRYPSGSAFREEVDPGTGYHSFPFLREPQMTMRRMSLKNTRDTSAQKEDTPSCTTSLTSLLTCLLTPAQPASPSAPAKLETDLMKPLPALPSETTREQVKSLPRRPYPTTFRNISYVPLSSLGHEDPYCDIQRRARRVRLEHVPGGLADEYFLPHVIQSRTTPARRNAPPHPTRPTPKQSNKINNKSAPSRRRRRLLPLPQLPPPELPYPTHNEPLLSSEHHWIPDLPALPAPAHCTDAQRTRHTPGPGIKIWTEKGPLVVECGSRPARVLEEVERFSVVVWEELAEWEATEEAGRWKGIEKGGEKVGIRERGGGEVLML